MNADQYQIERAEDNGSVEFNQARTVFALGIAGEAGEVADYMKKVIGHGKELDKTKLTDELGDVLWYVSQLAHIHGITMSEIMEHNTAKLRERHPHGFSGDLPHWSERVKTHERRVPDANEYVIKGLQELVAEIHRQNRAWLVGGIGSNDPIRKPKPKYLTRKPIPADGERIWVSWPDVETDYRVWLLLNASEIAESWEKHQHTIRWMHEWSMPSIKKEQQ